MYVFEEKISGKYGRLNQNKLGNTKKTNRFEKRKKLSYFFHLYIPRAVIPCSVTSDCFCGRDFVARQENSQREEIDLFSLKTSRGTANCWEFISKMVILHLYPSQKGWNAEDTQSGQVLIFKKLLSTQLQK